MKKKRISAVLLSGAMCFLMFNGINTSVMQKADAAGSSPVVEYLDRGINAVNTGSGMLVSWRFVASDPDNAVFKLYRDGALIYTSTEKSNGATCFLDKGGNVNSNYKVECYNGTKLISSDVCALKSNTAYYDIKLDRPGSIYTPNDMSVGDVDGDGVYELFLKWDPNNSQDNSIGGKTDKVYIDCYKLDGTKLWRIDLGYNIRAGAHYTQFFVADFDLDGKCEMTCKTSDGTVDGTGKVIGNSSAVHRNSKGFIITGPEYYTLFDGETGAALDTIDYEPGRGTTTAWGKSSDSTNRVDRFWGTTAYLDGVHPCIVAGRGYYGRMTAVAYTVENKKLKKLWMFDTGTSSSAAGYGCGNHNSMAADVDGDGKQEIITGASCIDDNGKLLWTTKQGHGDAMHVGDLDPSRKGLEVWICHEDKKAGFGASLVAAESGKIIFHVDASGDTGRCAADNVWAGNPGSEYWSSASYDVFDSSGKVLGTKRPAVNFFTYWDGDLEREVLDGYTDSPASVTKMNDKGSMTTLLTTDGFYTCNTTKGTPCLSADIFGDWREELIVRAASGDAIRIYCTNYDTDYRIQCLMHDPQYRTQVSAQQTAYNQPPHISFFLGTGYNIPSRPSCTVNTDGINTGKPGAVIDTTHKYRIKNLNSGLYMTLDTDSDNNVVQKADGFNGWSFESAGGGYYRIYSENGDGKTYLLDLSNGSSDNGTNIRAWTDTDSDAQLFKFVSNGDNTYTICTKNTGDESCIGVAAASKDEGGNIVQWACNESNDQKWILEIKVDPIDGNLIKKLLVKDTAAYSDWKFDLSLITGDAVFGDRDFTYVTLPDTLQGCEAIATACNSKNYDAELAEFTAGEAMTVYVLLDSRQGNVPAWLSGYTKTDLSAVTSNDVTFNIYAKTVSKGDTVILGTNGGATNLVNYTVLVKPGPIKGNAYIKELQLNDCESFYDWSLEENLKTGDLVFGDRDVTFTELPDGFDGATFIRTACDSKNLNSVLANFTAGDDETIYVMIDSRVATLPDWLSGYTKTEITAKCSNDVVFNIYNLKVAEGDKVILGTNGQSGGCVNYTVLVKPDAPAANIIPGNVNADDEFSVADLVMMQKYLLGNSTLTNWRAGDLCEDGVIDVFDMIMMRKLILQANGK